MLTISQVAEKLQVNHKLVRRWIKEGKLKAWNISEGTGRPTWRIKREWLEEFETDRKA